MAPEGEILGLGKAQVVWGKAQVVWGKTQVVWGKALPCWRECGKSRRRLCLCLVRFAQR